MVERLEPRVLLCGTLEPDDDLDFDEAIGAFPAVEAATAIAGTLATGSAPLSAVTYPLSSLPALNSLLGAAVSLYLDFDGHFDAQWGGYTNVTTPAFDQDGDATTFSDGELSTITQIWSYVAEDYAPFQINVTTVEPPSFANGVALRVAIGGNGSWTGGTFGGIAFIDAFTNSIVNTVYVFPKNLANGYPKYTAEASSHESGHAFGLQHQSRYDDNGNKIAEYYAGPGNGRAPIMGSSYSATRGLWWYGTSSVSATSYQDDMAVIARSANGFGYRADDHRDTAATATALAVSGSQVSGSGIITTTSDEDDFSFTTGAGPITLSVNVAANVNNLNAILELWDGDKTTLIASAAPTTSFGATITATAAAGLYVLVVRSNGNYGDVGQYTISGSIVPTNAVSTPTNLAASGISTDQINLTWTDNATNETGYRVECSVDGNTWVVIATLAADSTSYTDTDLSAGSTCYYRVQAFNTEIDSTYSNQASATTPTGVLDAPSNLSTVAVSSRQVDLSWIDHSSSETEFGIERRTKHRKSWTQIAQVGANITIYSDTTVNRHKTYWYRIRAFNSSGGSFCSNAAVVNIRAATRRHASSIAPLAPSRLSEAELDPDRDGVGPFEQAMWHVAASRRTELSLPRIVSLSANDLQRYTPAAPSAALVDQLLGGMMSRRISSEISAL